MSAILLASQETTEEVVADAHSKVREDLRNGSGINLHFTRDQKVLMRRSRRA